MSKITRYMRISAIALPIVFVACLLEQSCVTAVIDHIAFQVSASEAPSAGATSETMMISLSDGRKVEARYVDARRTGSRTCTVILFNGIGGSLSDWVHVQEKLHQRGISSVGFNYGDAVEIGQPRGKSRLHDVERVTNVIIEKIKARNGSGASYFLLGHSLGSAVVLQAYPNLDTNGCVGVILCNPFSSLKAWAIYHHHLPNALSFVMPIYYDNVRNIRRVSKPLLIVTSHADIVNPPAEALEVFQAAPEPKLVKMFDRTKHNDIFRDNSDEYWEPILTFIKQTAGE
jgi:alpha-beta hydrolase superfamily lysophospholipase